MDDITISPIGYLNCKQKERYEAPRQGVHAKNVKGIIHLKPHQNFEQAVQDLEGFDRVWLIYGFHLNKGWKPLVSPPRFLERKVGLFATRSPFRPNPLGISCVKVLKVEKLKIYITEFDLLDQTPIYDIKPYIPYSDSFPESKTGWLVPNNNIYNVILDKKAKAQSDFLYKNCNMNIENYAKVQLQVDPENDTRRRIHKTENIIEGKNQFTLNFRTWRVDYLTDHEKKEVIVFNIRTSYSKDELIEGAEDKKKDKNHHRLFVNHFNIYQK